MDEPAQARSGEPDAFLGGRLFLRQPERGHRAGTDAILLAAAAPAEYAGLALDVGSGVGAAGLTLALTRRGAKVGLIENDPRTADLARENLVLNGMPDRGQVFEADALSPRSRRAAGLADETAGLVISNPPFFDARRSRPSPDEGKRRAHVMPGEGAGALEAWIAACLALARPGGSFILIHRPENLAAILASLEGRAGGVTVLPVHAREGAPAIRILLRAKKGSRAPLSIAPALTLHEGSRFTAMAEAIHRGEAAIDW
jgi:tRNA1(Val) A37 N6-methylase TrmN6